MSFIRAHKTAILLIAIYYLWWVFLAIRLRQDGNNFISRNDPFPFILTSIILVLLYSFALIIQIIRTREKDRANYMLLLGIVKVPAIVGFFFLAAGA